MLGTDVRGIQPTPVINRRRAVGNTELGCLMKVGPIVLVDFVVLRECLDNEARTSGECGFSIIMSGLLMSPSLFGT